MGESRRGCARHKHRAVASHWHDHAAMAQGQVRVSGRERPVLDSSGGAVRLRLLRHSHARRNGAATFNLDAAPDTGKRSLPRTSSPVTNGDALQTELLRMNTKPDPLKPDVSLLVKLGNIAVHCDELLSPSGHSYDRITLQHLINDKEVQLWIRRMGALLPMKRDR
jgi:hypothetical protein